MWNIDTSEDFRSLAVYLISTVHWLTFTETLNVAYYSGIYACALCLTSRISCGRNFYHWRYGPGSLWSFYFLHMNSHLQSKSCTLAAGFLLRFIHLCSHTDSIRFRWPCALHSLNVWDSVRKCAILITLDNHIVKQTNLDYEILCSTCKGNKFSTSFIFKVICLLQFTNSTLHYSTIGTHGFWLPKAT